MQTLTIILAVVDILVCVALIVLVIMQQGNAQGLGSLAGSTETFFGKNRGSASDAMLKRFTTVLSIVFVALTLILGYLTTA